jgi:putative ABC transport system ATP-binding protein
MSEAPAIQVSGVTKTFDHGRVRALDSIDLGVEEGEFVAIAGPSGSGKSTLLHLLAALDRPTAGHITVRGRDLGRHRQLDRFRREEIGLVFQLHNLLPHLTAAQNIEVAMFGTGRHPRQQRARAHELLGAVGLEDRDSTRPPELSGGERQRVAIARALANDPAVLLADEPTGSLDSESVERVLVLLEGLRRDLGITILMVTHDEHVARRADRVVTIRDGRVASEEGC